MPSPIYILCAHDVIEDKKTNLVTIVKIIEILILSRADTEPTQEDALAVASTHLKMVCVWKKEEGDDGREFEAEVRFLQNDARLGEAKSRFSFDETSDLKRHVLEFPANVFQEAGWATIESRIRPAGTEEAWISQSCEILMKTTPVPASSPPE